MRNRVKQIGATALIFCAFCLGGCASIVHGTQEDFNIQSIPNHAHVKVDSISYGVTPTHVDLARKKSHTIELNLAGYEPTTIQLQRSISGWFAGNIVFGGIIGLVVDAVDGAMYKLTPEQISAYMASQGEKYDEKTNTLTIILVKHANKSWKKIGQLNKKA